MAEHLGTLRQQLGAVRSPEGGGPASADGARTARDGNIRGAMAHGGYPEEALTGGTAL